MPIWRGPTPRQAPWQPQPLRKPQGLTSAGGPVTYPLSGTISQTQSVSVVAQQAFLRTVSATQSQTLALVKQARATRSITQTQALALRQAATLTRAVTQAQTLSLRRAVVLIRALTQGQSLSILAQKVFLRTVSTTQAQTVTLGTSVRRTFSLMVSAIQAQVLSLIAVVSGAPPPVPVVVPSRAPQTGTAVSNYLDWPELIVTPGDGSSAGWASSNDPPSPGIRVISNDVPPPDGTAIGGP